jgi:hypothetical protein
MAELHAGMQRLQLDLDSPWSRAPTDLLNEAERALLLPVIGDGGPTSTLLTIRECIDGAISGLIPRRPTQEPAKSWGQKLSSIARQCGHPDIAVDVVERLAEDVGMLMNELSGAKQRPLTRREISRLFYRAAWFLKTFLGLIDEHRLKPLGGQR